MIKEQYRPVVRHTSTGDINVPLDFENAVGAEYEEGERITYHRDGLRYDGKVECVEWKNPRHTVAGWYYLVKADGRHAAHWVAQASVIDTLAVQ